MGWGYRKRTKGTKAWINVSRSGLSATVRSGQMTLNSRGRIRYNFGNGFFYTSYCGEKTGRKSDSAKAISETTGYILAGVLFPPIGLLLLIRLIIIGIIKLIKWIAK